MTTDKEDIHRQKCPFYHQLDLKWRIEKHYLEHMTPRGVKLSSGFEVFWPKSARQSTGKNFFKVTESSIEELFWNEDCWASVDSFYFISSDVLKIDVAGHTIQLSFDSWRIRPVLFDYISFVKDKENIVHRDKLLDPKSPRKQHKCSPECIQRLGSALITIFLPTIKLL